MALLKSVVFGVAVTWIAVSQGYFAVPTSAGIANATTRSVVYSSLAVLRPGFYINCHDDRGMVMVSQRLIESLVGLFLLFAIIALTVLAFKVSGLTSLFPGKAYTVTAEFDDIGGLKSHARRLKLAVCKLAKLRKLILIQYFQGRCHYAH